MESVKTLVFANIRFILKVERGHLERGRFMRLGRYELVSSKNVAGTLLSDDISFMGLFRRVP